MQDLQIRLVLLWHKAKNGQIALLFKPLIASTMQGPHHNYSGQEISDFSFFRHQFDEPLEKHTTLDLTNNLLEELPDWIADLVNLDELKIERNRLTRFPEAIRKLKKLKRLVISFNNIEIIPDWISELENLDYLDLCRNRIKNLPEELFNRSKLKTLDLSYNRIEQVPAEFSKLTELDWVGLNDNFLTSLPPTLMNLPALKNIRIDGNFMLEKLLKGAFKLHGSNFNAKTIIQAILDRQDDDRLRAQPPHIRRFVSYRALGHNNEPHNYSFRYELNRLLQNPIQGNQRYNWILMPHEVNNLEALQEKYKGYSNLSKEHQKLIGPLMVILTWNAEDEEVEAANDILKWAAAEKIPYFVYTHMPLPTDVQRYPELVQSSNRLMLLGLQFRDQAVRVNNIQDCALEMFKHYEDYSDKQQYGDMANSIDIYCFLILKKLRLQNIAHFEDVSLEFDQNMTCIVGRNGAGKSSLLYAIAIALLADEGLNVRALFTDYDQFMSRLYRILETHAGGVKIFADKGKIELTYSLESLWLDTNPKKQSTINDHFPIDIDKEQKRLFPTLRIELSYTSKEGKLYIDQVWVVNESLENLGPELDMPGNPIFNAGIMNLQSLVVTVAQHPQKYNPRVEPKKGEIKPSIDDVKQLIENDNNLHLERFVQWLINKYNTTHYHPDYGQAHAKAVFELINKVLYYEEQDKDDPQAVQAEDDNKWLLEYVAPYELSPAEIIIKTPTNPNGIQLEKSSQGIHHQLGWMGHLIRRLSEQHPHDMTSLERRLAVVLEEHPDDDMETRRKRTAKVFEQDLHDYIETLRKRSAVVIIDEIDQSLHPHWQARMLYDLTQVFPNVQFIVSAHSPLCLAGLSREQVYIIDKKEVNPCPVDLWALWGDEILLKVQGEKAPQPTKDINEIKQKVEELKAMVEEEKEKLEKMRQEGQDTSKQEEYVKKISQDLEEAEEQDRGFTFSQIYQPGYEDNWREYIELAKVERMKLSELVKKYQEKLKSISESQPTNS
jgi:predicted ATPase